MKLERIAKRIAGMADECGYEVSYGVDQESINTHTDLEDNDDIENVNTRPKQGSKQRNS